MKNDQSQELLQWQKPVVNKLDIADTKSGTFFTPEEGTWYSADGLTVVPTGTIS
ncbi:MAG: hypothetical protein OEY01_05235 [Desulfobulbaceae bacterium]|nr:hypothetical protein [Desulfobulbaceae bacterium]